MIRTTRLIALSCILLTMRFAQLAIGADGQAPTTEKLIEHLGSKEYAERERATQMLNARGPSVLPALKKALGSPDQEVRRRLEQLIPRFEAAVALAPKRVTLDAQKRPLSIVLKEIEKQTGYKVATSTGEDPSTDKCALKDVPFWEALDKVCRETGYALSPPDHGDTQLTLSRREARAPFAIVEGAFRVELTKLHEDRDIDFTEDGSDKKAGRREEEITATLSVLAEPRFLVLDIGKPRLDAAVDEDDKSLQCSSAAERLERREVIIGRALRELRHSTEIELQRSTDRARTIKVLRGTIPVKVVVERKPVVVTKSIYDSKGTKFKIGGETLEITGAGDDDPDRWFSGFSLEIRVPSKSHELLEWWRKRVHVEDANGNRLSPISYGSSSSGQDYRVNYTFRLSDDPMVGPPCKLIVEDWAILDHLVHFEFKEVPLP